MSARELIVVSGGVGSPSRTTLLADAIADAAWARLGRDAGFGRHTIEVSTLAADIGPALSRSGLPARAEAALQRIETAALLIVATPVYKGSYTGHFKHLFDLIDADALQGRPVALAATGGGERHALVVEHQLRPLFAFFRARTLPTAVYASTAELEGGKGVSAALQVRIDAVAGEIADELARLPALPTLARALAPV